MPRCEGPGHRPPYLCHPARTFRHCLACASEVLDAGSDRGRALRTSCAALLPDDATKRSSLQWCVSERRRQIAWPRCRARISSTLDAGLDDARLSRVSSGRAVCAELAASAPPDPVSRAQGLCFRAVANCFAGVASAEGWDGMDCSKPRGLTLRRLRPVTTGRRRNVEIKGVR